LSPTANIPFLQSRLLDWFAANKRKLPWRGQNNVYYTLVSEFMLQQTQVKTVIPYFFRFIGRYPTITELAAASADDLVKLWEGLGYYNRVHNLYKTAIIVNSDYKGIIPDNYEAIIELPGIGPYIAAAILSIGYNQPFAVVDGNVKRVLSRLFEISDPVNDSKFYKVFQEKADQLLAPDQPGEFNEALMELGATICRPGTPDCHQCPLSAHCRAYRHDTVANFPFRKRKARRQVVHKTVYVRNCNNGWQSYVRVRHDQRFLRGLTEIQLFAEPLAGLEVEKLHRHAVTHDYTHFREVVSIAVVKKLKTAKHLKTQTIDQNFIDKNALTGVSHKLIAFIRQIG
jgi:A/G-specific adenine glycosylase